MFGKVGIGITRCIKERFMMRREGFLTVKEAAQLLGVCTNTLRSWGNSGKITEFRHPVNNYRLYKKAVLERLLQRLERSAGSRR
jgi:DNA (cytosine-5)-methyltransferase 1